MFSCEQGVASTVTGGRRRASARSVVVVGGMVGAGSGVGTGLEAPIRSRSVTFMSSK